mgnify:CR=1 FL=1
MEQLIFDSGIKEFQINGKGILRFNPSDPNVYARFMDASEKIRAVERDMAERAKAITGNDTAAGEKALLLMREADQRIKAIMNEIFGHENDFDKLLENVNLMAVANNGERVITNLLAALQPIMEDGAKACASQEVASAKLNREQRRALK